MIATNVEPHGSVEEPSLLQYISVVSPFLYILTRAHTILRLSISQISCGIEDHISNIARSSRMKLGWILHTFQTRDKTYVPDQQCLPHYYKSAASNSIIDQMKVMRLNSASHTTTAADHRELLRPETDCHYRRNFYKLISK